MRSRKDRPGGKEERDTKKYHLVDLKRRRESEAGEKRALKEKRKKEERRRNNTCETPRSKKGKESGTLFGTTRFSKDTE